MRKLLTLLAAAAAAVMIGVVPAGAITNGTPDGNGHPFVGLMIAKDADGNPLWRCSGALVSSTAYLTAGHCTDGAAEVEIWFDSGYPAPIPVAPGYPAAGTNRCQGITGYPCTGDATGTPHTHPQYNPAAFYLYDLGLVTLDSPVTGAPVAAGFGALPSGGELSALPKHARMTAVGYGLQRSFPLAASWKDEALRTRMVATPKIREIDSKATGDFAFITSHDARNGGTCFGDSGGPNFIGDSNVIGGVTSFGTTDTCKGHNGVYRVDQPDDLDWLSGFGLQP